jgi:RHS repeat-associated protein
MKQGSELKYVHQDHLSSTSLMTNNSGGSMGTIKYYPFGTTRSGSVPTDKLFTGQRLDGTGLYYYGARYYDPTIGRFISPDTIVPNPANPQSFNRYSYCLNNPLKYTDPSGHVVTISIYDYWLQCAFYQLYDEEPESAEMMIESDYNFDIQDTTQEWLSLGGWSVSANVYTDFMEDQTR